MTEFHVDGQPSERTIKIKDYKLVKQLNNDTESGKLTWKNTYDDKYIKIFVVHHGITKEKKMMFTLKCSETSKLKDDNVLKVILKVDRDKATSQMSVIKTLHLIDYPLLNVLIKRLYKMYLGREFVSPIQTPSKAVEVNTVEDYRKHILIAIKDIMKKLPGQADEWESKFMDVFVAYDNAKKSTSYEELNDLLQKATKCAEKSKNNKGIGDPWWVRR